MVLSQTGTLLPLTVNMGAYERLGKIGDMLGGGRGEEGGVEGPVPFLRVPLLGN